MFKILYLIQYLWTTLKYLFLYERSASKTGLGLRNGVWTEAGSVLKRGQMSLPNEVDLLGLRTAGFVNSVCEFRLFYYFLPSRVSPNM